MKKFAFALALCLGLMGAAAADTTPAEFDALQHWMSTGAETTTLTLAQGKEGFGPGACYRNCRAAYSGCVNGGNSEPYCQAQFSDCIERCPFGAATP